MTEHSQPTPRQEEIAGAILSSIEELNRFNFDLEVVRDRLRTATAEASAASQRLQQSLILEHEFLLAIDDPEIQTQARESFNTFQDTLTDAAAQARVELANAGEALTNTKLLNGTLDVLSRGTTALDVGASSLKLGLAIDAEDAKSAGLALMDLVGTGLASLAGAAAFAASSSAIAAVGAAVGVSLSLSYGIRAVAQLADVEEEYDAFLETAGEWFIENYRPDFQEEVINAAANAIRDDVRNQVEKIGPDNLQGLELQVNFLGDLTASQLAEEARTDVGTRFALENGYFHAVNNDLPIYDDPALQGERFTDQYLQDRANFIKTRIDTVGTGFDESGPYHEDLESGEYFGGHPASNANILFGGGGDDPLLGSSNDDRLYGRRGSDYLDAGGGDDYLEGGAGNGDTLIGGAGNDTYVYLPRDGHDNIFDIDGQGQVLIRDEQITGTSQSSHQSDNGTVWESEDGSLTYTLTDGNLTDGGTLEISGSALGGDGNTIKIEDFENGELGINLNAAYQVDVLEGDQPNPFNSPDHTPTVESVDLAEGGTRRFTLALNQPAAAGSTVRITLGGDNAQAMTLLANGATLTFEGGAVEFEMPADADTVTFTLASLEDVDTAGALDLTATFIDAEGNEVSTDATVNLEATDEPDTAPETTTDITGDEEWVDLDTSDPGVQPSIDALDNRVTTGAAAPGQNDVLRDSAGNDRVAGGGGNDILLADRGGNDHLLGDDGDDAIQGGSGADLLEGGAGGDGLAVDPDDEQGDRLFGDSEVGWQEAVDAGNSDSNVAERGDLISAGGGADLAVGSAAGDLIGGNGGDDRLAGGAGDDFILGDDGLELRSGQSSGDATDYDTWSQQWLGWQASVDVNEQGNTRTYRLNLQDTASHPATNPGDDLIHAGAGSDYVVAGAGEDLVFGEAGEDVVFGGAGDDTVLGGAGADVLNGDSASLDPSPHGNDFLDGGDGDDELYGGAGTDQLFGGAGDDIISADDLDSGESAGNDQLHGEAGEDQLYGMGGNDTVFGGTGDDVIYGDAAGELPLAHQGDDTLHGGAGADVIFGQGGDDTMTGGADADQLLGDSDGLAGEHHGDDTLSGGAGDDFLWGQGGNDDLSGNAGADQLVGDDTSLAGDTHGDDTLHGGDGTDSLFGTGGNDTLTGGLGDDHLEGDSASTDGAYHGDDVLTGDQGSDTMLGGGGSDTLRGGADDDTLVGDDASIAAQNHDVDLLFGGGGNDSLNGQGGDDALYGGTGNDQLQGDGASTPANHHGADLLFGGLGDDVLAGHGGDDTMFGETGADDLYGGDGADHLDGGSEADVLSGNAGDDILEGGSGDDLLLGGTGTDVLIGGGGFDIYEFAPGDGDIHIRDTGDNRLLMSGIRLDQVSLGLGSLKISVDGTGDTVHIEGFNPDNPDQPTGITSFEFADGTLSYQQLIGALGISQSGGDGDDTLIGTNAADNLYGFAGNDHLIGRADADRLFGGTGADTMEGQTGDDTYYVDDAGDTVIENADEGDDTVVAEIEDYTLAGAVENLRLGDGIAAGAGNAAANTLTGNAGGNHLAAGEGNDSVLGGAGNDVLQGGSGVDLLHGGDGNDELDGGAGADREMIGGRGDDTYHVDDSGDWAFEGNHSGSDPRFVADGYDTIFSSAASYTMYEVAAPFIGNPDGAIPLDPIYNEIESLQLVGDAVEGGGNSTDNDIVGNTNDNLLWGNEGDDTLDGGDGDDVLEGGDGVDSLQGGAGNDDLNGGRGADTLAGGAGDDHYRVSGADILVEDVGGGIDTVEVDGSHTLQTHFENLMFSGDDAVGTGNAADNTITGDSQDNVLDGADGADTLIGAGGHDHYRVDDAGDTVVEDAGEGYDTVESTIDHQLDANVERLELTGSARVGTGNAGDNALIGNDLDNALYGGAGDDLLDGAAGADTMAGGGGDDIYEVDDAGDTVDESSGSGHDEVRNAITYTLGDGIEDLSLTGSASIDGTGNALDNTIRGNDAANALHGRDGNDALYGGYGEDALYGDAGDDHLEGGAGNDLLAGGAGDDTYLLDGHGDTIQEQAGEGIDTVENTTDTTLANNVENLELSGRTDAIGLGNNLDNSILGNQADNTLEGRAGDDMIDGAAGNDALYGDEGDDYLYGGDDLITETADETPYGGTEYPSYGGCELLPNSDLLLGGNGDDHLDGGSGNDELHGGAGDDTLYGGDNGLDAGHCEDDGGYLPSAAAFSHEESGAGGSDGDFGGHTNHDRLYGGAGDDVMDGGVGVDQLFGGAGADQMQGGDGDDVLDGGDGLDTMEGGGGDDVYYVDGYSEVIEYPGGGDGGDGGDDNHDGSDDHDCEPGQKGNEGVGNGEDPPPPGHDHNHNDGPGTSPGSPGAKGGNGYGKGGDDRDRDDHHGHKNDKDGCGTGYDEDACEDYGDFGPVPGDGSDDPGTTETIWHTDEVIEADGGGLDTVYSAATFTLPAHVERLFLTGEADIDATGNSLDNTLRGNTGANVLDGGAGADAMAGGLGDDTYVVGQASDQVTEHAGEGIDTVRTAFAYTLGANVENLTLTGEAAVNATGNALANELAGNSADNTLTGLAGDDVLAGGAGADVLAGGAGDDTYVYRLGDGLDRIDDAQGANRLRLGPGLDANNLVARTTTDDAGQTTMHVRLVDDHGNEMPSQGLDFQLDQDGNAPISEIVFDDGSTATLDAIAAESATHEGDSRPDWLDTGSRDDTVHSRGGSDAIWAGAGRDTVYGGGGGDGLYGQAGSDRLFGQSGRDTLAGGNGFDVLSGGAHRDELSGGCQNDLLLGGADRDRIDGDAGNDLVAGGTGDDRIRVQGADVVMYNAGDGKDRIDAKGSQAYTLSLGGDLRLDELELERRGHDLILDTGASGHGHDRQEIHLEDWYAGGQDAQVTLQLVMSASEEFDADSADPLRNRAVQQFDFNALAAAFEASGDDQWQLTEKLLDAHLGNADDAALGGELAYEYATAGQVGTGSSRNLLEQLGDPRIGEESQRVQNLA